MKIPNRTNLILVPFSLDQSYEFLIRAAGRVALQTKSHLRLLHVITPLGIHLGNPHEAENISRIIEDESIRLTQKALQEAAGMLPPGVEFTTAYTVAKSVPEAILSDAAQHHAALILCGVANVSHDFLPKGLSTVLSLMANAPVPVMAIPATMQVNLHQDSFNLLVTDDLYDEGFAATKFSLAWACELKQAKILHIHVNKVGHEEFQAKFIATMGYEYPPIAPPIDVDEMYRQYLSALGEKLKRRVSELAVDPELVKGRYATRLLTGPVAKEIKEAAQAFGADAIVFGRHKVIHSKPLGIGSVSYRVMLQQKYPIIVVPSGG